MLFIGFCLRFLGKTKRFKQIGLLLKGVRFVFFDINAIIEHLAPP